MARAGFAWKAAAERSHIRFSPSFRHLQGVSVHRLPGRVRAPDFPAPLEERNRLYRNFQVRFSNEQPAILLFYPVYTYAVGEHVQGVTMGPLFETSDRFATVTSWFLNANRTTDQNAVDDENSGSLEGDNPIETP